MSIKDKLRVMVVDDMATSRGLILQALDAIGLYNTDFEGDGASAFRQVAEKRLNLVISDFNMPGMDGLELLKALRSHAATKGVGFILVTGSADQSLIARGRALGMNNFIKKPFTAAEMKSCIEAVVGRL